jgi:predicted Zn-dependent protease with MMP-like domain
MTKSHAEIAPNLDDIETLARRAFGELPGHFRRLTGDIVFRIEDYADDQMLDDLQIEDPLELTGLYSGVDLTTRGDAGATQEPTMVFLFRMPILFEWAERGDVALSELVAHILVHEIGHHFGLSDDDMDALLSGDD